MAFSARDKIDLSNIDFRIRTCVRGDAAASRNRRTRVRTRPLDVAAIVCPRSDGKRVFDGFSRKSSFPRIVRVRVFRRVRTQTVAATLTVFTWYRDGSRVSPGTLPGSNIWHDEHDFTQAYDTYQRVRWKYGRTQQQQQKLAGRNPDGDRRVATRRIRSASPRTETHGALDFEYLFIRSRFAGFAKIPLTRLVFSIISNYITVVVIQFYPTHLYITQNTITHSTVKIIIIIIITITMMTIICSLSLSFYVNATARCPSGSQHHNVRDLGTLRPRRSGSGDGVIVGGGGDSSVPLLLRGEDNKVRAQRDTSPPLPPPPSL